VTWQAVAGFPKVNDSFGNGIALVLLEQASGKKAIYRYDDEAKTFARIDDDDHQFAGASHITGDPRVEGRVYLGTGGRGILYGAPK
jgi:hypothetical protein